MAEKIVRPILIYAGEAHRSAVSGYKKIEWQLETPVREDIYEYIVKG